MSVATAPRSVDSRVMSNALGASRKSLGVRPSGLRSMNRAGTAFRRLAVLDHAKPATSIARGSPSDGVRWRCSYLSRWMPQPRAAAGDLALVQVLRMTGAMCHAASTEPSGAVRRCVAALPRALPAGVLGGGQVSGRLTARTWRARRPQHDDGGRRCVDALRSGAESRPSSSIRAVFSASTSLSASTGISAALSGSIDSQYAVRREGLDRLAISALSCARSRYLPRPYQELRQPLAATTGRARRSTRANAATLGRACLRDVMALCSIRRAINSFLFDRR